MRQKLLTLIVVLTFSIVKAQKVDSVLNIPFKLQDKYYDQVSNKSASLNKKITSTVEKYILRLQRIENRIQKKLQKVDPTLSKTLFGNSKELYNGLLSKIRNVNEYSHALSVERYIPHLDEVQTSLKFIKQNVATGKSAHQKLRVAIDSLNATCQTLDNAEDIKQILKQRRQYLLDQLIKAGLSKELKMINREVYYYASQINEYKDLLNQPEKIEKRIIYLLRNTTAFQKFMQEHSEIAILFPVPDNYGTQEGLQGLQTRNEIQQLLKSRVNANGSNSIQIIQQNIQAAQAELTHVKDRISQLGGMSNDSELPDFKPNSQRTKPFLKRLELGANLQTTKANSFFPVTTDVALTVGYKLNDKGIVGIAASYKIGWGKDIRHITISHEGIGMRSFIDWKLKRNFYISGGYEQNYRSRFYNARQLTNDINKWQSSGLIGISKKTNIGKRRKADAKLLFDFLYRSHVPVTQPLLFRVGYTL